MTRFDAFLIFFRGFASVVIFALVLNWDQGPAEGASMSPQSDRTATGEVAAEASDDAEDEISEDFNDPLEFVNRLVFGFNEVLYRLVLDPITIFYESMTPPPVQNALSNVVDNLKAPVTLANDLLQGEGQRGAKTTNRFMINTVIGLGGLFDPAADWGLEPHEEDFGQTLAVWGVPEGFYLVLPVLGPSNPRDAVGQYLVDPYADLPGHYLKNTGKDDVALGRTVFGAIDGYRKKRSKLERVRATSLDYYASIRNLYRQKRKNDIRNGLPNGSADLPDLSFGFSDETTDLPPDVR